MIVLAVRDRVFDSIHLYNMNHVSESMTDAYCRDRHNAGIPLFQQDYRQALMPKYSASRRNWRDWLSLKPAEW